MRCASTITSFLSIFVALASFAIAFASLRTARGLNRAKFLYDLHRDIFVSDRYRSILELLDQPCDHAPLVLIIDEESAQLIDLLNVFELVAYFVETGQLKDSDVDALLGYYLGCIERHLALQRYIEDRSKSFEQLDGLLKKRRKGTSYAR